jgi:hypothetical protein
MLESNISFSHLIGRSIVLSGSPSDGLSQEQFNFKHQSHRKWHLRGALRQGQRLSVCEKRTARHKELAEYASRLPHCAEANTHSLSTSSSGSSQSSSRDSRPYGRELYSPRGLQSGSPRGEVIDARHADSLVGSGPSTQRSYQDGVSRPPQTPWKDALLRPSSGVPRVRENRNEECNRHDRLEMSEERGVVFAARFTPEQAT